MAGGGCFPGQIERVADMLLQQQVHALPGEVPDLSDRRGDRSLVAESVKHRKQALSLLQSWGRESVLEFEDGDREFVRGRGRQVAAFEGLVT